MHPSALEAAPAGRGADQIHTAARVHTNHASGRSEYILLLYRATYFHPPQQALPPIIYQGVTVICGSRALMTGG